MSKVIEIAISENSHGIMKNVDTVETVAGKGLVNDRHFKENNNKKSQITLIEIENISHYNKVSGTSILPKDFRRNIITQGIQLNELVGKEILVGDVKMKVHRLCDPCRYLQELLVQKHLVKKLLNRGGLRCELLTDGSININDVITVL